MPPTCERATVIITAVGPYQLHGPELVAACAATGTAYVDLCGEPAWMRRMIDAHHEEAKRTGARIVFSCGFDSIPFDLGVLTLQEKAREKFGRAARRVKLACVKVACLAAPRRALRRRWPPPRATRP
jgi:short subunit dehydrogenase-like uncharacterized protein